MPAVFARQEVPTVLAHLVGTPHLMVSLLYGAGLRLIDFAPEHQETGLVYCMASSLAAI